MLDPLLFLGFPIDDKTDQFLRSLNPQKKALFISEKGDYFQQTTVDGVSYLGKKIGHHITLENLKMSHQHLKSLIPFIFQDTTTPSFQLVTINE